MGEAKRTREKRKGYAAPKMEGKDEKGEERRLKRISEGVGEAARTRQR